MSNDGEPTGGGADGEADGMTPGEAQRTFEAQIAVRFNDVDHARVVYFPKYLDYCHEAFEEFVESAAGRSYASLVNGDGLGYPAVHAEIDYFAPSRFGDVLCVRVACVRIGTKSVTWRYLLRRRDDGTKIADARITVACIDMESFTGVPVPDSHRRVFSRYRDA